MPSWRSNVKPRANSRRYRRYALNSTIRLLWYDTEGSECIAEAKVVEVSVSGLKLCLDRALPVRSFIVCNDRELGVAGGGTIRYCIANHGKYEIGVEFSGGTGWREPTPPSP
jgi:hypothetical protein